jgi:hypothetical protein
MRSCEMFSIMFCTFSGVLLPMSTCRPSGGGPPDAAALARNSAKNASAKSRLLRSAMMLNPPSPARSWAYSLPPFVHLPLIAALNPPLSIQDWTANDSFGSNCDFVPESRMSALIQGGLEAALVTSSAGQR